MLTDQDAVPQGSSGIEVAAVTSIVLTNRAATMVVRLRKVSAFIVYLPGSATPD
ncbi:MAG: hypothetical protein AVDCRST_MAG23-1625 [uncultured Sphingosinicella sp.]|uniref:Uncharacterized protein n=1 Tax=uncultured Sphingosinicella sp. TaxID=478748 RepID=A0A6J4U1E6_9SPHN|nr:MAG: hypothetical protein AVDCRST_MAG23-1625 [uncultured Sphingosinicella sp.]